MAKQTINIGSAANDGTGSTLRESFDITNDNFTELYSGTGGLFHKIEGTNFTGSLLIGHNTTGTLSSALNNTGIGIGALDALTSGDSNVAIGRTAGGALSSGSDNIAIGHNALKTENTGSRNTALGRGTLQNLDYDGNGYNTAVGYEAGNDLTTGIENAIVGALAGDAITTGTYNAVLGTSALGANTKSNANVAIGNSALATHNLTSATAGYNVAVGFNAGVNVTTGKQNTIIGGNAGDALTTGNNNIVIGYDAAASAVDVSNEVTIGNSSIANVRIPSDSTLKIGASSDLQLEHLSGHSYIKNTDTGDLYIENQVTDGDIIFRSDNGSGGLATYFQLDGSHTKMIAYKDIHFDDNIKATFGNYASSDLQIYHNGTTGNSNVDNNTGDLYFSQYNNDGDIIFRSDDGSGGIAEYFRLDGGLTKVVVNKSFVFEDNIQAQFGSSADLSIYHGGTNSVIDNLTGDLIVTNFQDDGDIKFLSDDGSNNTTEYFRLDGSNTNMVASKTIVFNDDVKASFGSSEDLRILHDGTDSQINNVVTGDLYIQNFVDGKDIIFRSDDGSGGIAQYFRVDGGEVETRFLKSTLHFDNVKAKFGDGGDLEIYHDGSHSIIKADGTGNLILRQDTANADIVFKSDDGSGGSAEYFRVDGGDENVLFSKDVVMSINAGPTLNMNTNSAGNTSKILLHEGTTASPANGASIRYDGSANNFRIGVGTDVDTTRLTIDRGTGLATFANNVQVNGEITASTANATLNLLSGANGNSTINFADPDDNNVGQIIYRHNGNSMSFDTTDTERMRIDSSGSVLVGTTAAVSSSQGGAEFLAGESGGRRVLRLATTNTSVNDLIVFINGNGTVGTIRTDGSATSFNTSSDYRLKEDLKDFDGLDKVSKIPVYDFKWKVDDSRSYGVLAHELEEVIPNAVSGEKDADEMQGVDYSKVVPLLIKSIQELEARVKTLENK